MGLFEVDIKGFKQTIQGDAARILCEPISNAWDTEATEVGVDVAWERGTMTYAVTDNDAEGFALLADAYTLFAPSRRREIADKRGRFGYGEKEFIALAYPGRVEIATTTGTVIFDQDTRTVHPRTKLAEGSAVKARFRLSRAYTDEFVDRVNTLLVPAGVTFKLRTSVGDEVLRVIAPRKPVMTIEAQLPTVNVDEDGNLRPTKRVTKIDILDPLEGETPTIYELGIPVVAHGDRYSINVHQKVPLNRDRDNVPPSYLRLLRELVLNKTHELLDATDAKSAWVTEALPKASPEAIRTVVEAIHGKNAVI